MVINPAPSNFLSRQKLDDYLLEILSEAGKDEISDRWLMKAQENVKNTMGPLGCLWAHLDDLKKEN